MSTFFANPEKRDADVVSTGGGADDQPPDSLDLIWGAEAIAKELKVTVRRAFYLLERGELPARKVGGRWVAARRRLWSRFLD